MSTAESIIHINITQSSQSCGEIRIVLLLFRVETGIFQQNDIAILCSIYSRFNLGANTVIQFVHPLAQYFSQAVSHGLAHRSKSS